MFVNGLITAICNVKLPTSIKLIYCFRIAGCGTCSKAYRCLHCSQYSDSDVSSSSCSKAQSSCTCTGKKCCVKCRCNDSHDERATFDIELGWKCIFGPLLCNKCGTYCPNDINPTANGFHTCCNSCNGYACPLKTVDGVALVVKEVIVLMRADITQAMD